MSNSRGRDQCIGLWPFSWESLSHGVTLALQCFLSPLYGSVDFEFLSALAPLHQEGREQPQLKVCPKAAASRTVGRGIHRGRSAQLPR